MRTQNRNSWLGIILVAIGGLLIADNFEIFHFDLRHMIFSWHTIFVIIGLVTLSNSKSSVAGIIFLLIGLWGYATHMFPWFIEFNFGDIWPIILILIGLSLLFKKKDSKRCFEKDKEAFTSEFIKSSTESTAEGDTIDETAILTSSRRYIISQNFRGGEATAILGGITLDFSKAKLAPGENQLEITSVFGGCKLYIPRDWKVIVNVTSVFGGVDDKRFTNFEVPTSDGVLLIKGSAVFGGAEIFSI